VAVLWLLRSLLSTELDVLVVTQVPVINALVLGNPCRYRHKSYIARNYRFFGLHFCHGHYRSIFNHCDVIYPKATEFGEITQNEAYYTVHSHSRSPILVPIESPYATYYMYSD